jgi:L-aspartate oxidase
MLVEAQPAERGATPAVQPETAGAISESATERWITELRELMWKYAGLLRDKIGLHEAQRSLDALAVSMPKGLSRRALEARNLHTVAELIVAAALGREESRGAHYRNDFPQHSSIAKHSVMQRGRLHFVTRTQENHAP